MRAIVFQNGKLGFDPDHPMPQPAAGEALVRVSLAGVCTTDLEIFRGYMSFNGVPGHEFAGVVEAGGGLAGQRVAGEINCACGGCDLCAAGLERHCPGRSVLGIQGRDGAFAEYLTLPIANLHPLPDAVSDEAAVFIEPLAAAFEIIEQVDIGASDSVCVLGDGRLGLLAAQVLALRTASLMVVGRHPEKLRLLQLRDIATAVEAPDRRFDFVVDCTGSAAGLDEAMALVRPLGTIVLKTTVAGERSLDFNRLVIDEVTLVGSRCGPFAPAIQALAEDRIDVAPMISRTFPLEEGIEAMEYAARPGTLKVLLAP